MKYLILTRNSKQYAEDISKLLWQQRKPVSDPSDVTDSYFSMIEHPTTGKVALVFPDEPLRLHSGRNPAALISLISEDLPSEQDKDSVAAHINNLDNVEDEKTIDVVLPSLFAGNLKTYEQMDNSGWFPKGDL